MAVSSSSQASCSRSAISTLSSSSATILFVSFWGRGAKPSPKIWLAITVGEETVPTQLDVAAFPVPPCIGHYYIIVILTSCTVSLEECLNAVSTCSDDFFNLGLRLHNYIF